MTLYRGPGGTGSATSDADTTLYQDFLNQTIAARDAALQAEINAELAETNAETAETNAETAETNAETAATNAASSASAAASSASSAATSASNASTSASAASASATAAASSASSASSSASAASISASNAATSETNAASSASSASTSATNAANSASTATTQATNAASSATAAASSASSASTSATNAANSASSASTSATNAANSATAAAASASEAAGYAASINPADLVHISGTETITGAKTFSQTITGSITGNAGTVTNGVYTTGDQTIGGTKTFSSNPILSAGTVNGLAFLNASKVLTTGSALTFDGTNLGIGTSSPSDKLHVVGLARINTGTYAAGYGLTFQANSETSRTYQMGMVTGGNFAIYDSAAAATRVTLDTSGNLGLGVTPSAWGSNYKAIESQGNSAFAIAAANVNGVNIVSNAYATNAGWFYKTTGPASYYNPGAVGVHQWFTAPSGTAGNAISFTQAMTLDASGNLGVGTSSPSHRLHVNGNAYVPLTNSYFCFNSDFGMGTPDQDMLQIFAGAGNGIRFGQRVSGTFTERARIDSSGNLLVGKTGFSATTVGFQINGNTASSAFGNCTSTIAATTNSNSTYEVYSTGAGAYRFYVGMAGTVFATSTTISAISDQRLKENIQDIDVGLDTIMALKPRKFDWKEGKGKNVKGDRGWIAQEFEQVFPDMIDEWRDPSPEGEEPYKSVRADLIPVLVKAIQEQQMLIEDQRAIIDAQQAALNQLKAQLTSVSADVAALKGA